MKEVAIIGTVGVPACYGGFETLVENILDYTPDNINYTVYCSSKRYSNKLAEYKKAKLVYLDCDANGKDSIRYDYQSMKKSMSADVMLILGVSGCLFLPIIRRKYKGKILVNIDGLEWKRDKWSLLAKIILKYSEWNAVRYSDVVIGDNQGIVDYVNKAYKIKSELIAYGGDHINEVADDSLYSTYPFCNGKYAMTVCRIEPENNIEVMLDSFCTISSLPYVIVGNWLNSEYGKNLRIKYSHIDNMYLLDPIYDSHVINWMRTNASLYIHGHSAGGTNPSLVEAMHLGLPILAYDCIYNRETTKGLCLYWKDKCDLVSLLGNSSIEISHIGKKMKELGKSLYTWKRIAGQYEELY
jgi:glycosyltransferase involved in cell wall biosynthesis